MIRVRKGFHFIILCLLLSSMQVQAAPYPRPFLPPHLIQSVSEQEIYEGMISLGMLECPVLEKADREKAYENVKNCVVRVCMGKAHGSGLIWKFTPDRVIIATNKHVLSYWQEEDSYLYFLQGHYMDAKIIGVSEEYDVGFLAVENDQFTYRELEQLRSVPLHLPAYEQLVQGEEIFCVGAGSEVGELLSYEAQLEDPRRYIADFDAYMLYGYGFARTGMSGGGIFDGYGNLIGMVTGGTLQNEIAGVPLTDLMRVYEEIEGAADQIIGTEDGL